MHPDWMDYVPVPTVLFQREIARLEARIAELEKRIKQDGEE